MNNGKCTKADLKNMVKWIRSKDPFEQYNAASCDTCLLAQFFKRIFPKAHISVASGAVYINHRGYAIPKEVARIVKYRLGSGSFQWSTFGDALKRTKAELAKFK